jgi:hypothetical protein
MVTSIDESRRSKNQHADLFCLLWVTHFIAKTTRSGDWELRGFRMS